MYELMNVYLENGLKVVLHRIPSSKTMACGIWVKQGSMYEDDQTSGLSHLLEHLIVTSGNSKNNHLADIESKGIVYNATTTKEFTSYYFSGISEHLNTCISALSNLVVEFDGVNDEAFENEKNVVLREASSYYSSFKQISERSSQALWGNGNVGRIIVGDVENIGKSSQSQLMDLYNQSYTPENSVLVIVGGFDYYQTMDFVKERFNHWEDRSIRREVALVNKEPGVYINTQNKTDNAIVSVCFKLPEFESDYRNALEVVSLILGDGGVNSRLAQEIRVKRGLAYIVNSYESFYEDRGLLGFASVCQPTIVSNVVEIMINEFAKCKKEGFSPKEISAAKNKLITKRILGLENVLDHLKFLGRCAIYNSTFSLEQEIRNIKKVDGDSINRIVEEIFHENNLGLAVIGNVDVDSVLEKISLK